MLLLATATVASPDVRRVANAVLTKEIGAPDGGSRFVAPSAADPPALRIAAVGDVGTGGAQERRTAETLDRTSTPLPYDVLLLLGDNVYPSGDPSRLDATVFHPFRDTLR